MGTCRADPVACKPHAGPARRGQVSGRDGSGASRAAQVAQGRRRILSQDNDPCVWENERLEGALQEVIGGQIRVCVVNNA